MTPNKTLRLLVIASVWCLAPHALVAVEKIGPSITDPDIAALQQTERTAQEVFNRLAITREDAELQEIAAQVAAVSLEEAVLAPPGLPIPTAEERKRNSAGSTGSRRSGSSVVHHSPRARAGTMAPKDGLGCLHFTPSTPDVVDAAASHAKASPPGSPYSATSDCSLEVPPAPHNSDASPVKKEIPTFGDETTDKEDTEDDPDSSQDHPNCPNCLKGTCWGDIPGWGGDAPASAPRRSPSAQSALAAAGGIPNNPATPPALEDAIAKEIAKQEDAAKEKADPTGLDEKVRTFVSTCWKTIRGCPRRTKAEVDAHAQRAYDALPAPGKAIADWVMAHSTAFKAAGIGITIASAVAAANAYDKTTCMETVGADCGKISPWVRGIIATMIAMAAHNNRNQDPIEEGD